MADMYCANHATCPLFSCWSANESTAKSLIPIETVVSSQIIYKCKALEYCKCNSSIFELFLNSLPEGLRNRMGHFENGRGIVVDCCVLSTLNKLEALIMKGIMQGR